MHRLLFTCVNCALILLIVAEKLNCENSNDIIIQTGSTFEKEVSNCVEFDPVLPVTNCSSISLTVTGLFTFKEIYDVIFVTGNNTKTVRGTSLLKHLNEI